MIQEIELKPIKSGRWIWNFFSQTCVLKRRTIRIEMENGSPVAVRFDRGTKKPESTLFFQENDGLKLQLFRRYAEPSYFSTIESWLLPVNSKGEVVGTLRIPAGYVSKKVRPESRHSLWWDIEELSSLLGSERFVVDTRIHRSVDSQSLRLMSDPSKRMGYTFVFAMFVLAVINVLGGFLGLQNSSTIFLVLIMFLGAVVVTTGALSRLSYETGWIETSSSRDRDNDPTFPTSSTN